MAISRFYIDCSKRVKTEVVDPNTLKLTVSYAITSIKGYLGSADKSVLMTISGKETIVVIRKFFTSDFTINEFDYIVYDGKTYQVIEQPRNTAHRNHHMKCKVRQVENIKQ